MASAEWAPNQSGCSPEGNFPFSKEVDFCQQAWNTDFFCVNEDGSETTSFGGGYVYKTLDNVGCILFELYAYSTSTKRDLGDADVLPPFRNITSSGSFNASNSTSGSESGKNRSSLFTAEDINRIKQGLPLVSMSSVAASSGVARPSQ